MFHFKMKFLNNRPSKIILYCNNLASGGHTSLDAGLIKGCIGTLFQPFKCAFLSINLDQNMPEMCIF